ncbi:MAG TPA: c-type cytochrome domain-containing protein [Candidatus Paceibacterota bacterium]|nr:c-type cytochrome domain-containing protein [Candidatus Paceibacterota bacterium]
MKHTAALLIAGLLTAGTAFAEVDLSKLPPPSSRTDVTFEKDILPMFKDSCVRCHGAERPKAGLRLDSAEAAVKGGKDGKVIEPGNSAKSDLVISIARLDPETAMPPMRPPRGKRPGAPTGDHPPMMGGTNQPGNGPMRGQPGPPPKPLTPEQVGLVRAWIDQGAK